MITEGIRFLRWFWWMHRTSACVRTSENATKMLMNIPYIMGTFGFLGTAGSGAGIYPVYRVFADVKIVLKLRRNTHYMGNIRMPCFLRDILYIRGMFYKTRCNVRVQNNLKSYPVEWVYLTK